VFRVIHTKEENNLFNELWGDFCEENEIPFLKRTDQVTRYGICDEEKRFIGTIELSKFHCKLESEQNYFYEFSRNKYIKFIKNEKIYEISKLLIDRENRGKGHFKQILLACFDHATSTDADWYIGTINKRLYMFARSMGFKIVPIDEYFNISDNIIAVPFLLDAKHAIQLMQYSQEFKDLLMYYENKIKQ
jgi:predicted GNAT family N-acyltransferase